MTDQMRGEVDRCKRLFDCDVRKNGDTAEIINPDGKVFCSTFMGEGVYETLTKKRAETIAGMLNDAKKNGTL